jgi:cell division protease FtsH
LNDLTKNILLWVIIVLVLLAVFSRYMPSVGTTEEIRYSTFLDDVKTHRVDSVIFQGDMLYGSLKDKQQFKVYNPETDYSALIGELEKAGV